MRNQEEPDGAMQTETDLTLFSEEKSSIEEWLEEVTRGDYENGNED